MSQLLRCLVLLMLLQGCAAVRGASDQMLASPADYRAYRAYRLQSEMDAKLAYAWRYLKMQPEGRFRPEVERWFGAADRSFREAASNRPDRLMRYLRLMPDAPGAIDVRDRLAELQLAKSHAALKHRRLTEEARSFEERLADAKSMRETLLRSVTGWVVRLAGLRGWGSRLPELDHEFVHAYRLQQPAAKCNDERCVKLLSLPYAIPERRRLVARRAVFDVQLLTREGRVEGALIAGPQLFDRVAEAGQLEPVQSGDALARAEAIGKMVQIAASALETALPAQRCHREAVSPVVLERECDGLRVRVIAAETPEQEDRIEFVPTPR